MRGGKHPLAYFISLSAIFGTVESFTPQRYGVFDGFQKYPHPYLEQPPR
jgi:hypothetical protein